MNHKLNILTLLAVSTGLAQVNFTNPDEGAIVSFQTTSVDSKILKAEGSPYFDENFKYGQILINGEIKTTGNLRYNAANSELELQKGEKEYSAVLKRNYISAKIDNKLYKLFPYIEDSNSEATRIGYFIPLNQGEVKLLYKPEKKLRRGRTGATNYDRTVPPRFIDISSYYIQIGEEPAKKIYLRKKYFYDMLDKERVKSLIKENDLRLNKEEDAIKLLQFYDNKNFK
ncbi:hypothetical protein K1F50_20810 [Muricauda oceani]|uniref:Uncharacterized protein n=1 Tax=Flagellimonas oceani TaxID=2698672 RepID=A0A6G7J5H8_9FLAO|nr:hypothetical protein [Allomuricauda oceani]MBW8245251.1 hypothetical protein [Allomuricauda oceani]QII45784.1 hypothetical protein GVT53_14245 [Allomuricauda oceani]